MDWGEYFDWFLDGRLEELIEITGLKEKTVREHLRKHAVSAGRLEEYEAARNDYRKKKSQKKRFNACRETYEEWVASGVTVKEFAASNGLNYSTVQLALRYYADKANKTKEFYLIKAARAKRERLKKIYMNEFVMPFATVRAGDEKAMALARKANQFIKACVRGHDPQAA